ncbi:hypothetical protein HA397_28690, partial [Escherichia coli]|nr:hypothetical protein [Escherichia coli]
LLYANPIAALPKTALASALSLVTIGLAKLVLILLELGLGASAMSFFVYVIVGYGVFGLHIHTLGRIGAAHIAVGPRG